MGCPLLHPDGHDDRGGALAIAGERNRQQVAVSEGALGIGVIATDRTTARREVPLSEDKAGLESRRANLLGAMDRDTNRAHRKGFAEQVEGSVRRHLHGYA